MNKLEIEAHIKESEEITKIERARADEYAKLSYPEMLARRKGFANYAEYYQDYLFKKGKGTGLSMSENKNCTQYLGVYIAERLLPDIFQNPKMMPNGNHGYDAICKNGYKVDVKSSVLCKSNYWMFNINQNKIADAFLCIAFNSRADLNIQHIWLISENDIVRNKKLNELKNLVIYDTDYSKICVKKYELKDKKNKANNICILFKAGFLK